MIEIALAAALAAQISQSSPAGSPVLVEARQALDAGRTEQARLMIAKAVASGQKGPMVDRLVADLAFAKGNFADALTLYEALLARHPKDARLPERAAIAALKLGLRDRALPHADRAVAAPGASWRAWNARAVIADLDKDWESADTAYAKAAELAPEEPGLINNRGWSQLLRGNWQAALDLFERAAALSPHTKRIANNVELARVALSGDLPARARNESSRAWAARLNDAGVAARLLGDQSKAVAAFTRAIQASEVWYARAANNLQAVTAAE